MTACEEWRGLKSFGLCISTVLGFKVMECGWNIVASV